MKQRRKKAKDLKELGNAQLRKKDFRKAVEYYTMALDEERANKYIWTNRALAHIKLR